jgi:tetratricopeptide (TPR) repeat protein
VDTTNPVIQLCLAGTRAEFEKRHDEARVFYLQAWEAARDDYEACIAAHYLARMQENPAETLRWNREALIRAEAVGDERVRGFYPSLYVNLGVSHEKMGNRVEAQKYFALAAQSGMAHQPD